MLEPFTPIDALVGPMGRADPPKVVKRLRYEERGDAVVYANIYDYGTSARIGSNWDHREHAETVRQSAPLSYRLIGLAIIRRK